MTVKISKSYSFFTDSYAVKIEPSQTGVTIEFVVSSYRNEPDIKKSVYLPTKDFEVFMEAMDAVRKEIQNV